MPRLLLPTYRDFHSPRRWSVVQGVIDQIGEHALKPLRELLGLSIGAYFNDQIHSLVLGDGLKQLAGVTHHAGHIDFFEALVFLPSPRSGKCRAWC